MPRLVGFELLRGVDRSRVRPAQNSMFSCFRNPSEQDVRPLPLLVTPTFENIASPSDRTITHMKTTLTLALAFSTFFATAQLNVVFEIDHMLGTTPVSTGSVATNNIGDEFEVSRLQYYISKIGFNHDGGQFTAVPSKVILANALTGTSESLGSFDITTLESVVFGVGVEASLNHLDPAMYDANDPLAPQSPSMHWGWSPGYRFIAMEGSSGPNMAQNYELHGLGDVNYHVQTIPTSGVLSGNTLTIKLIANYEEAMRDINVAIGPVSHAENGYARDMIDNFRYHVFTSVEGNGPVGIADLEQKELVMYPNPTDGSTRVSLVDITGNAELRVHDATGKLVQSIPVVGGRTVDVELNTSGIYQVSLIQQGRIIAARTLVRK